MPASDRSLDIIAFVTEHFRDILRRRLSELAGLLLLTLALLGAIALATWSVQDPSLSHATQKPIHNLLGFPGAIFSDLAMQLLGLAAILLLLPETLLGWRLLAHKPLGEKWRSLVWIAATLLAAGFASTLPRIGSWPLPTGLGGVLGRCRAARAALADRRADVAICRDHIVRGVRHRRRADDRHRRRIALATAARRKGRSLRRRERR